MRRKSALAWSAFGHTFCWWALGGFVVAVPFSVLLYVALRQRPWRK